MRDRVHSDQDLYLILHEFATAMNVQGNSNDLSLFRHWLDQQRTDAPDKRIPAYSTFSIRFGSWHATLEHAGLPYPQHPITKRTNGMNDYSVVRSHFLTCIERGTGMFTPRKYQLYAREHKDAPRFRQLIFQYQSWDQLLSELNEQFPQDNWLQYSLIKTEPKQINTKDKKPMNWNDWTIEKQKEYTCEMIWKVSQMHHGDISPKIYTRAQVYPNLSTVIRRFGTWEKAVKSTLERLIQWQRDTKCALIEIRKNGNEQSTIQLDGFQFSVSNTFDRELAERYLEEEAIFPIEDSIRQ